MKGSSSILKPLAIFVAGRWRSLAGLTVLGAILLWAYWPTLKAMADRWSTDPQYSHGFLVPVFAAVLLWLRRARLQEAQFRPAPAGLLLIGLGIALHLAGARYYYDTLDMLSLLPVLAGLCLCYGGLPVLGWAWPALAFLVFMLPLPYRIETALSQPLRQFATRASTYTLQTLGFAAVAEGNSIFIGDASPLRVDEACNGLGMLVTFFALTVAVAIVVRRRPLDRGIIVLSAIPIAVIANVVRITLTGILHAKVGGGAADIFFHDVAGWLMMTFALGLLWIETWLLSRLLREPDTAAFEQMFGRPGLGAGSAAKTA